MQPALWMWYDMLFQCSEQYSENILSCANGLHCQVPGTDAKIHNLAKRETFFINLSVI
jgi:hypothetical protein